ncbi:flagellin [Butyrivibrio proteoclasticus]|uniref:Flagellin n=1 Tax=Butyrivibrio proteoclasticus TaxID=43305 RepID=A0A1I5SW57_9FIRM|nr:flagellin [Butyrivibrio proteoclasticus]SFP74958.1 flagellin [Butyrivibrio proteoclasticus]
MSSISSVSGYGSYSPYSTITAGGTYQSASQGASELAIQEKTKTQVNGLDAGSENLTSAKSVLNIEDGAMDGITDYLQSIRELSVKAKNGILSDSDRQSIQNQIEQYKQGIEDIAGSTNYNEKNLLDGSNGDFKVATDSNGSVSTVSTYNSTLEALGIADYDVTGDFDIGAIDSALEKVTSSRANVGAQSNGVDYALSYNSHAALELNGYQMDKEEDNSIKAYQKLKTQQALDSYQMILQKKQMEDKEQQSLMLFA